MARHAETSPDIDGFTYRVTQLRVTEGLEIMTELTKMILPSVGTIAGEGLSNLLEADLSSDKFSRVATHLATSLTSAKVKKTVDALARSTEIFGPGFGDGGAPLDKHLDTHFAGRYGELISWLVFALKVNYGNFTEGLVKGGLMQPESDDPPQESQ